MRINLTEDERNFLAELLVDLADRRSILRFDERDYEKWARPNKHGRKIAAAIAKKVADDEWCDWDTYFEQLEKPKFNPKTVFER